MCRVQKLNDSRAHFQETSAHPPRAAYDRRAHSPLHLHTSARFERHKKPSELTSVADLDHAELFATVCWRKLDMKSFLFGLLKISYAAVLLGH